MPTEFAYPKDEIETYDDSTIENMICAAHEAFDKTLADDGIAFVAGSDEVKSERKPSLRNEPIPEPKGKRKDTVFPRNFIKDLIGEYDENKIAHLPEFLKCYEKGGEIKKNFDAFF